MITVLVDHNIEGWAGMLARSLQDEGWSDLLDLPFIRFPEVGLSKASTDREVWRLAQQRQMILLTANRKMTGPDSLEETIRLENDAATLPDLTIGTVERLLQRKYRIACGERLVEIILDLNDYLGTGRLFIP